MKRFFDWAACGTAAQYRKHLRHGIPPCQACLEAERRRVQDAYRCRKRRALMPPPVEHEAEPDRTELTEIPEPPRRLPFGGVDEQWLSDFSQMIRQVNANLNAALQAVRDQIRWCTLQIPNPEETRDG